MQDENKIPNYTSKELSEDHDKWWETMTALRKVHDEMVAEENREYQEKLDKKREREYEEEVRMRKEGTYVDSNVVEDTMLSSYILIEYTFLGTFYFLKYTGISLLLLFKWLAFPLYYPISRYRNKKKLKKQEELQREKEFIKQLDSSYKSIIEFALHNNRGLSDIPIKERREVAKEWDIKLSDYDLSDELDDYEKHLYIKLGFVRINGQIVKDPDTIVKKRQKLSLEENEELSKILYSDPETFQELKKKKEELDKIVKEI